jgi:hypothetical protein
MDLLSEYAKILNSWAKGEIQTQTARLLDNNGSENYISKSVHTDIAVIRGKFVALKYYIENKKKVSV